MLWNPCNEDFDMQYSGLSIRLSPGEKQLFPIACASHLLNAFGQRGLTSLVYGSEEEKVGEAARQRNYEFKKRQVVEYNQRNENRKSMGMGYLPPGQKVKDYALELGVKLLEPYSMKDEERAAISNSSKENEDLKRKLADQAKEMSELKDFMREFLEANKPKPEQKEEPSQLRVKKDGKWTKVFGGND